MPLDHLHHLGIQALSALLNCFPVGFTGGGAHQRGWGSKRCVGPGQFNQWVIPCGRRPCTAADGMTDYSPTWLKTASLWPARRRRTTFGLLQEGFRKELTGIREEPPLSDSVINCQEKRLPCHPQGRSDPCAPRRSVSATRPHSVISARDHSSPASARGKRNCHCAAEGSTRTRAQLVAHPRGARQNHAGDPCRRRR